MRTVSCTVPELYMYSNHTTLLHAELSSSTVLCIIPDAKKILVEQPGYFLAPLSGKPFHPGKLHLDDDAQITTPVL
jgi:hypothetical protein